MNTHIVIHRLAFLSLLLVAVISIAGGLRQAAGVPLATGLASVIGFGVWGLLLWKIWKRPRQWGLGVGIFLFLMNALQCWLYWQAIHNSALEEIEGSRSIIVFLVIDELPIFIAGVSCTLLTLVYPKT